MKTIRQIHQYFAKRNEEVPIEILELAYDFYDFIQKIPVRRLQRLIDKFPEIF